MAIPRLRAGTCFPGWLLERRRRAKKALTSVVETPGRLPLGAKREAEYLLEVSSWRRDRLVEAR